MCTGENNFQLASFFSDFIVERLNHLKCRKGNSVSKNTMLNDKLLL